MKPDEPIPFAKAIALGKWGTNRYTRGDIVTSKDRGNSRNYILARLDRDGHAELAAKVRAREMSAHEAARQMRWRSIDPSILRHIIFDDKAVLDLLDQALKNPVGRPVAEIYDIVKDNKAPTGNSPEYELRLANAKAQNANRKPGRPPKGTPYGIRKLSDRGHDGGTSASYTLRRLLRERPALVARVENGDLSVNAAAIEAGRRRPQLQQPTKCFQRNPPK